MNLNKFLSTIFLIVFLAFASSQLLAAGFNIDNLNLQEALPISNPPKAYFKVGLKEAWQFINDLDLNLSPITIGIVDSGFDSLHPEFRGVKLGSTPLDAKTDIGEVINGNLESHGTNVVGIIGANNISATSSENYIPPHMNGVVSGVKNLDYTLEIRRVSVSLRGIETIYSTAQKIYGLSKSGAQIINLSRSAFNLGGGLFFEASFNVHPDILFIVSAGNNDLSVNFVTPANLGNLSNVITVGAATLDDKRVSDSNFGSRVNISAPGEEVLSPTFFRPPLDQNDYEFFSGTSASAPMVTGVAAILKALEPEYQKYTPGLQMTPAKIKEILQKSADPIVTDEPLGSGCFDQNNNPQEFNGCRLNAHRAVAWLFPPIPVILEEPEVIPK